MKLSALFVVCAAAVVVTVEEEEERSSKMRIAGGQDAEPGQFPWLVSIRLTNFQDTWFLCGGIIIAPQWVLTTAHCLETEKPQWLVVRSGDRLSEVAEGTEQTRTVDHLFSHPDYIYYVKPYVNDVGLVHLTTPFTLDAYTKVAPLPVGDYQQLYGPCIEAGWGATKEGGAMSTVLQWVSTPILSRETCQSAYSSPCDPNAICAGNMEGGQGGCVGDNGGGLMCYDSLTGDNVVSGVMSWREGCARPGKPGVYMDITGYKIWINTVVNSPLKGA